jgi:hypothetical protein
VLALWFALAVGATLRLWAYASRDVEAALASNIIDGSWGSSAVVARRFIYQQLAPYFYVLLAKLATCYSVSRNTACARPRARLAWDFFTCSDAADEALVCAAGRILRSCVRELARGCSSARRRNSSRILAMRRH